MTDYPTRISTPDEWREVFGERPGLPVLCFELGEPVGRPVGERFAYGLDPSLSRVEPELDHEDPYMSEVT